MKATSHLCLINKLEPFFYQDGTGAPIYELWDRIEDIPFSGKRCALLVFELQIPEFSGFVNGIARFMWPRGRIELYVGRDPPSKVFHEWTVLENVLESIRPPESLDERKERATPLTSRVSTLISVAEKAEALLEDKDEVTEAQVRMSDRD